MLVYRVFREKASENSVISAILFREKSTKIPGGKTTGDSQFIGFCFQLFMSGGIMSNIHCASSSDVKSCSPPSHSQTTPMLP